MWSFYGAEPMLPLWGVAGAKQTCGIEPKKDEWLVENDMTLLEDKNSVCSGFFFFQRQGEWTHFTREEGEEAQCIFLLVLCCKTVAAFLRVCSSWANNDNECSTVN